MTRKVSSKLIERSGETTSTHLESWMLSQSRRLASTSEFFTTSREDSKLTKLTRRKLSSNSAESKRKLWAPRKSPSLLLTTAELSDSPTQRSKSWTQSR